MEDGLDGIYVSIEVRSEKFREISRIEQHRMVLKALEDLIASNEIHAVKIKTRV
ncbi:MAG: BolA/IbaG family iron-sulfur metabolism protein [Cardiobacteriaceae bacterium]|nr:BolA/IbaG family iron-sulfur metabolism protein [Cardiobacteriaceae bacterium]